MLDTVSSRSPHGERGLKLTGEDILVNAHVSLPARGAWIEILSKVWRGVCPACRSPHGERGLKYAFAILTGIYFASLPARGAWIEMVKGYGGTPFFRSRSPHGERGLKFAKKLVTLSKKSVAPRTGSVD